MVGCSAIVDNVSIKQSLPSYASIVQLQLQRNRQLLQKLHIKLYVVIGFLVMSAFVETKLMRLLGTPLMKISLLVKYPTQT